MSDLVDLADWAVQLKPSTSDIKLADRSLVDTVAVTLAGAGEDTTRLTEGMPEALRFAAIGHVLDFDDVHLPSTSHISVVCVAAALATGGGAREYLAGAGVMARLGSALGWAHYQDGWHATCTAGAPAAAITAGLAFGLDAERLRTAMALAVPGAGGVQRAFGTSGKSLQVGFAAAAGVRAAELAARGASADPAALRQWFDLVGGRGAIRLDGPVLPDGLAIKLHPCCYALQRPISVARELAAVPVAEVRRIVVHTPEAVLRPLIHDRPDTGLAGKFSLRYGVAAALLDGFPGLASFTDAAVHRREAVALMDRVEVKAEPGGAGILAGHTAIELHTGSGVERAELELPRGHPELPPSEEDLAAKVADCAGADRAAELLELGWPGAAELLRRRLGATSGTS